MVSYGSGADEGYVSDVRVRGQVIRDIRPADDRLDNVRRVTASDERRGCNRSKVAAGPSGSFGTFDYYGVACEYRGYYRRDEVVELSIFSWPCPISCCRQPYGITIQVSTSLK